MCTTAGLQRCDMTSGYQHRQCAKLHGLSYSSHLACSKVRNGRGELLLSTATDNR